MITESTESLSIDTERIDRILSSFYEREMTEDFSSNMTEEYPVVTSHLRLPISEHVSSLLGNTFKNLASSWLVGIGICWSKENSAQILPLWWDLGRAAVRRQRQEEKIADFFEPISYEWDEDIYQAIIAAEEFSERTHADY